MTASDVAIIVISTVVIPPILTSICMRPFDFTPRKVEADEINVMKKYVRWYLPTEHTEC